MSSALMSDGEPSRSYLGRGLHIGTQGQITRKERFQHGFHEIEGQRGGAGFKKVLGAEQVLRALSSINSIDSS